MPAIRIRARIELLTAAAGGRTVPIRGSYRPNHNFGDAENAAMAIGFLELRAGDQLGPGEVRDMELILLTQPLLEGQLVPGRTWRIQEGPQLVGFGTILAVLSPPRPAS